MVLIFPPNFCFYKLSNVYFENLGVKCYVVFVMELLFCGIFKIQDKIKMGVACLIFHS
jgi:hypothetical protein